MEEVGDQCSFIHPIQISHLKYAMFQTKSFEYIAKDFHLAKDQFNLQIYIESNMHRI